MRSLLLLSDLAVFVLEPVSLTMNVVPVGRLPCSLSIRRRYRADL